MGGVVHRPPPTYNRGGKRGGRGWRAFRCPRGQVSGASAAGDRRGRGGLDLRVKKGYKAGTSRGWGSEGDTRCPHRDCRWDREGG